MKYINTDFKNIIVYTTLISALLLVNNPANAEREISFSQFGSNPQTTEETKTTTTTTTTDNTVEITSAPVVVPTCKDDHTKKKEEEKESADLSLLTTL